MAVQTNDEIKGTEKEFLDLFSHLCYSRTAWQVWSDLMSAMACTIANVFETNPKRKADREKEYERCIKELGGDVEIPAKLFAIVTMALENNPDQDFLGKLYMQLNLGSHWHGQFFTPYDVCKMMSLITIGDTVRSKAEDRDYIAVSDPACGAGCEFPYKSRVMPTSEPLKTLKAPYMARNTMKWGFFRLKSQ